MPSDLYIYECTHMDSHIHARAHTHTCTHTVWGEREYKQAVGFQAFNNVCQLNQTSWGVCRKFLRLPQLVLSRGLCGEPLIQHHLPSSCSYIMQQCHFLTWTGGPIAGKLYMWSKNSTMGFIDISLFPLKHWLFSWKYVFTISFCHVSECPFFYEML